MPFFLLPFDTIEAIVLIDSSLVPGEEQSPASRVGQPAGSNPAQDPPRGTSCMTADSYRPHVGVHLILAEGRKVLLFRRANTGFADGCWFVPGGSLEHGETLHQAAAREAMEETGVTIDAADLSFAHLCHRVDPGGLAGVGVFFTARH
jgi:hypothetical protein